MYNTLNGVKRRYFIIDSLRQISYLIKELLRPMPDDEYLIQDDSTVEFMMMNPNANKKEIAAHHYRLQENLTKKFKVLTKNRLQLEITPRELRFLYDDCYGYKRIDTDKIIGKHKDNINNIKSATGMNCQENVENAAAAQKVLMENRCHFYSKEN